MRHFDDAERDVTAMGYMDEDDGYGDVLRDVWLAEKDFEETLLKDKEADD